MIFFRRRRAKQDEAISEETGSTTLAADTQQDLPEHGPWDLSQQPELGQRVDVGGIRVPARKGMQMRMELEPKSRRMVAVNIVHEGTAVQLQAFAAPRTMGIWEELREEIAESITSQGGSVQEQQGTFGPELLGRLPVRAKDGRTGVRPVRFVGVDGDRWFLRAVVSGKAAVDEAAADDIDEVLKDVVVVRGDDARPPRELLPLHLPGKPGEEQAPVRTRAAIDLDKGRGPEITEVG